MMQRVPSDGLQLAVEDYGTGPAIVYAHGLTGSRHWSRRELAPLADSYRTVIYDQRGHGDSSPVTDPQLYAPHRMAADLSAVLDALNLPQAIVGGESMGCATTLLYALAHPERISALFLVLPAFADEPNPGREAMKTWGRSVAHLGIDRFARKNQESEIQAGCDAESAAAWADILRCHQTESLATALQTVADWVILPDLSPLARLNIPVQLLAAPNNTLHPLALAERMAAALPNARLHVLASPDETLANPPIVGHVLRRFLQSL